MPPPEASLVCASCQATNRSGRKFCARCGTRLPAACPACGFVNEPGEDFCGGCGIRVATGARAGAVTTSPPPVVATPPPPPVTPPPVLPRDEAERRQLTVMFCDLVGSTALSTKVDAEDLRDLIRAYQERTASQVEAFDGFIARYMGDGILIYFGYPRAHEDDAERAVRAALAIVDACSSLGAQVRIGIASGVAIVGDVIGEGASEERTVVGDAPNLAARLQTIAEPNSIVVSDTTRALLPRSFDLETLGERSLKGFAQPVLAFRVRGVRQAASRFESRRDIGLTPLVGRERELGLLTDRWSAAVAGDGQVVVLSSEAGLGKSRLVAALRDAIAGAPHHDVVLQGSTHYRASPLRPAIEWLARTAGLVERDDPAENLARLEAIVLPERRAERVPLLAALLSIDIGDRYPVSDLAPEQRKEQTLLALTEQLEDLAADRPTLVVFEDVQWADPTSLDLVDRLVAAARTAFLLVLTCRPEMPARWASQPHATQLTLNRLTAAQSAALVAAHVGPSGLKPAVAADLVRRADGVPLFIEELSRAALESGAIAIPATLQESLLARLDRLPASREVAQAAAVLGREFTLELLSATTHRTHEQIAPALRELTVEAVILDHGGGRYSFKHALVRDVAYQSLLRRRRQALHEATALALSGNAEISAAQPELVAHHFSEAHRDDEALVWWQRAAARAEKQWAYAEVAEHLGRALALLGPSDQDAGAALRRVSLELERANAFRLAEDRNQALAMLDSAESLAVRFDFGEALSRIFFTRGNLLFQLGRIDACREAHERALAEARRSGSLEAEVRAWGGIGDAAYARGAMVSAREALARCVELAEAGGFYAILADNLPMAAHVDYLSNDFERCIERAMRAVALARDHGRPRGASVAELAASVALFDRDRVEEAIEHATESVNLARRLGLSFLETAGAFMLSRFLVDRDRTGDALELIDRILDSTPVSRRNPGGAGQIPMTSLYELALATRRAFLRGEAIGRPADLILKEGRFQPAIAWVYQDLLDMALQTGDLDAMAAVIESREVHTTPEPLPRLELVLSTYGAALRIQKTADERARQDAARARAELEALGHPRSFRRVERLLTEALTAARAPHEPRA
jgi:class 3 adenylate cyclase/tetratricopeptide (TPR) repeat protein